MCPSFLETHVFVVSVLSSTPNHILLKYRCSYYYYVGFRDAYLKYKGNSLIRLILQCYALPHQFSI